MRVTVFGAGYGGLVTGACLSEMGDHVLCVDVDSRKIDMLQRGELPIHEPGLDVLIKRNAAAGRLSSTADAQAAVAHGTLQFIGVGTPPDEDGSADLQYKLAVARTIGQHMTDYKVVIDKCTVPVGTADKVRAAIAAELAKCDLAVAHAVVSKPEFLKEGAAIEDFMKPDGLVVGSDDDRATLLMRAGRENQVTLRVLDAVEEANDVQKQILVERVVARFGEDLSGRTFALWGLAFKPNTDDMREAPSRVIIEELSRRGARIQAYDPVAMPEAKRVTEGAVGLSFADSAQAALQGADALLIVTEWREFRTPDFDALKAALKQPLVLDGRNLYEPELMAALGIDYVGVGRGVRKVAA